MGKSETERKKNREKSEIIMVAPVLEYNGIIRFQRSFLRGIRQVGEDFHPIDQNRRIIFSGFISMVFGSINVK